MKPLRVCWYALMTALFFAGRLTGQRAFFLLLFIMGFVYVYSLALNLWTVLAFSYYQKVDRAVCVKGGEAMMRLKIYNDKPFPFAFMRLMAAPVTRSERIELNFSLLPRSHITFTVPLACPYRGVFGVGMTELEVSDCFGLVNTRFHFLKRPYYRQPEITVYPRLCELYLLPAKRGDPKNHTSAAGRFGEHGQSYSDLRKHRPGDPLKRVHRAVSARKNELYVKTYDVPYEASVLIALDTAAPGETEDERFRLADLACECVAAIAHYSLKAGRRVLFCSSASGGRADMLESMRAFPRLYDRLAQMCFHEYDEEFIQTLRGVSAYETQAVYAITARTDTDVMEALTCAPNGKLIALSARKGHGRPDAAPSLTCVRLAVGDDVAAALSEQAGLE